MGSGLGFAKKRFWRRWRYRLALTRGFARAAGKSRLRVEEIRYQISAIGKRGRAGGEGFAEGGTGDCAAGGGDTAGGEWAGSDFDCGRAGVEYAGVGERDARVSVPAMAGGSAPGEIEGGVSAGGGKDRVGAFAGAGRCVCARVAAERRAGIAFDSSWRRADELDYV